MILYLVEYIAASDVCDLCQDDPAGRIEKTDNPSSRRGLFSQDDINKGKIAFQHFTVSGVGWGCGCGGPIFVGHLECP